LFYHYDEQKILVHRMTLAYVYKWTELATGKWYVGARGARGCHPDDGYICSSKVVKPQILANPDGWKREILFTSDPEEVFTLKRGFSTS